MLRSGPLQLNISVEFNDTVLLQLYYDNASKCSTIFSCFLLSPYEIKRQLADIFLHFTTKDKGDSMPLRFVSFSWLLGSYS